jgi:hypothetical protein
MRPTDAASTGSLATATITKTSVAMTMSETMSVDVLRPVGAEWTAVLTPYA